MAVLMVSQTTDLLPISILSAVHLFRLLGISGGDDEQMLVPGNKLLVQSSAALKDSHTHSFLS